MPRLHPEIQKIADWATGLGWRLDDRLDGQGHYVLRRGRDVVRLPASPGEYRGLKNARALIRKKSGVSSDAGPAARYRHEPRRDDVFDMDEVKREQAGRRQATSARVASLHEEHRDILERLADIRQHGSARQQFTTIRALARRCLAIEAELKELGRDV